MRLLFLLLVLANLALFAWSQASRESALRDSYSRLEVMPEKIRVNRSSGGSAPERPAPPAEPGASVRKPAAAACVEWGIFTGPEVARAEAALARAEMPQERVERTTIDGVAYWVYLPPMKSKAETDRKVGELKALGVTEFFVVTDASQWRNAISLGIFRTEEAAQAYLNRMKERGVRSAVAERRENFLKQIAYLVREPDAAMVAKLAALQTEFPGSELRATACPAAGAKG